MTVAQLLGLALAVVLLLAVVVVAAWWRTVRAKELLRHRIYFDAVALALAAWGRDRDDPHNLPYREHITARQAVDQAGQALACGDVDQMQRAQTTVADAGRRVNQARAAAGGEGGADALLTPVVHVLTAPSLAELTAERLVRSDPAAINMRILHELVADAGTSAQVLEEIALRVHTGKPCDTTVEQLLALSDEDLRRALEGLALSRGLWQITPDWTWLRRAEKHQRSQPQTPLS